jgi:hypothetical protein
MQIKSIGTCGYRYINNEPCRSPLVMLSGDGESRDVRGRLSEWVSACTCTGCKQKLHNSVANNVSHQVFTFSTFETDLAFVL